MKRLPALLIAAATLTVLVGGLASAAQACSFGSTCHGVILWNTPANTYTGGLATINASTLSVPNGGTDLANHEMWVVTNNGVVGFLEAPFVEEGLKYGSEDGTHNLGLVLFWAEYNTSGTFAFHQIQSASLNTNYAVKISYSGSSSWGVYLNGNSQGGTGHLQPCCVGALQVGGETSTASASINGTGTGLQKRLSDGVTWNYGWPGSTHTDGPSNPIVPSWTSSPTAMTEHT